MYSKKKTHYEILFREKYLDPFLQRATSQISGIRHKK